MAMNNCRYEPMCCHKRAEYRGKYPCPQASDCHCYHPMPDVAALLKLAKELREFAPSGSDGLKLVLSRAGCLYYSNRIREACGVTDDGR